MSSQPDVTSFADGLVEESFDEAAFLWRRWEDELTSLTRNLDEVWSWTEDRLHGALDGVRVAGSRLTDVVASGLRSDELNRVTVSAALLSSSEDPRAAQALAAALEDAEGPALRAIVRGVELLGAGASARAAIGVLGARGPEGGGELCRLKAFRRVTAGSELATAFDSGIPEAQVGVMRAASCLPPPQAQEWIEAGLRSATLAVQSAAVEAGVGRGIDAAWRTAVHQASPLDPMAAPYLKLLALLGASDEHEIIYAALRVPVLQIPAIWALGHLGTARAVEACLAGMQYEPLARACGEAYCWITGADLSRDRLAKAETLPDTPAFEDDDLDADLVPPPEALWPMPDPEAVQRHWQVRQAGVEAGARYVLGWPASMHTVLTGIETGPMLRRPDLVLELRARTRGQYDVETRAFTARQREMMAAGRPAISGSGR